MNIYKAFVYMFYAMDAVYDNNSSKTLGNYLSGLNPFLFNDESSADPAEYEKFKKEYIFAFKESTPTSSEVYDFCTTYLSKYAPKAAYDAFKKVEKGKWTSSFEENENN